MTFWFACAADASGFRLGLRLVLVAAAAASAAAFAVYRRKIGERVRIAVETPAGPHCYRNDVVYLICTVMPADVARVAVALEDCRAPLSPVGGHGAVGLALPCHRRQWPCVICSPGACPGVAPVAAL